jgi:hypothetical protein
MGGDEIGAEDGGVHQRRSEHFVERQFGRLDAVGGVIDLVVELLVLDSRRSRPGLPSSASTFPSPFPR